MSPENRKKREAAKHAGRTRVRYDSVQKLFVSRVEKDAKQIEKGWYQEVFIGENLTLKQFDELGKKYGIEKEAKIAFVFSQNPNLFKKDNDWFPYLQNFYIVLAERELEARARGEVINDPFMRIYLKLKKKEIDDFAYKMRYYVYYKDAKFKDEDLLKYVSAIDIKVMKLYIDELADSHANTHSWFDAFQRLYINVVKSLQILRNYSELLNKLFSLEIQDYLSSGALDTENELKKYEGFLGNPEIDEAIKRKTVALINAILSRPKIEPPFIAPERYMEKADKKETAKNFLLRVYGKWLRKDEEVLFQDQLRKLDEPLINALKTYCWNNKLLLANLVPPKKVRVDRELALQAGNISELERLAANFRRRQKQD